MSHDVFLVKIEGKCEGLVKCGGQLVFVMLVFKFIVRKALALIGLRRLAKRTLAGQAAIVIENAIVEHRAKLGAGRVTKNGTAETGKDHSGHASGNNAGRAEKTTNRSAELNASDGHAGTGQGTECAAGFTSVVASDNPVGLAVGADVFHVVPQSIY